MKAREGLVRLKKLTIRFKAVELEILNDVARVRGLPTATFARVVLLDALRNQGLNQSIARPPTTVSKLAEHDLTGISSGLPQ